MRSAVLVVSLVLIATCNKDDGGAIAAIVVRDKTGSVTAQLRPGHPCRATIGSIETIVDGPPLVGHVGEIRWTGVSGTHGTTLVRDGTPLARISHRPQEDARTETVEVLDPHDVLVVSISREIGQGWISDGKGAVIHDIRPHDGTFAIVDAVPGRRPHERELVPDLVVSGTADPILAGMLTAPELAPEIRMLAACDRALEH